MKLYINEPRNLGNMICNIKRNHQGRKVLNKQNDPEINCFLKANPKNGHFDPQF